MSPPGWPLTFLLIHHFGSASSSPFITPAPVPSSQMSPPTPLLSNLPFPHHSITHSPSTFTNSFQVKMETNDCDLSIRPSVLVVRFGDPFKVNCSINQFPFSMLGWEVSMEAPLPTMENVLMWSVKNVTEWDITAICYSVSDVGEACSINLPLTVYKPPNKVSIQFSNHNGSMIEGHQYSLRCTVEDVAPVQNLAVTFYKGQTALHQFQSNRNRERVPVNTSLYLTITPRREDDGCQYWCEAKLELGPAGPNPLPVVTSQIITAAVIRNPERSHPTSMKLKDPEISTCVRKPNHQSLGGSGTKYRCKGCLLLIAILIHILNQP